MVPIACHIISACVVLASCVGFWGEGFIHTVIFNKEQTVLTAVSIDHGPVVLAIYHFSDLCITNAGMVYMGSTVLCFIFWYC